MKLIDKYNCILCKYRKYGKSKCYEYIKKDKDGSPADKCRSLSNIYYGTLVKCFPFNIIQKIINKKEKKKALKFYEDFNEDGTENSTMKHIWGLRSVYDMSHVPTSLLSMNDFDITYLKDKQKYILGIETFLCFDGRDDEKEYLTETLKEFTKWMKENNYDTNKKISIYDVFSDGYNINTEFNSLEEAYAMFKLLVTGF